ncbi:MAG: cupin-like domain-containing protein [Planctomycetaceae bacterium]|nr:cupin-like domain-containing protein [Planctomycetaceae bacterium]
MPPPYLNWEQLAEVLLATAGESTVQVRRSTYGSAADYLTNRQYEEIPLSAYLNELCDPDGEHQTMRYAGNVSLPVPLASRLDMTEFPLCRLSSEQWEPPAYWIGPTGSLTPLHKDSTPNLAYQIFGTKRWVVFPVRDIPFLRMSRPNPSEEMDFAVSEIAPSEFKELTAARFHPAVPLEFMLEAGDVLYLPAGWAHFVENRTTSVMVNRWMSRAAFRKLIPLV